jgi:hypothetical protein
MKKKILTTLAALVVSAIALFTYETLTWEHYSKELLPDTASDIREHRTDSFPSDFLDCMIARISADEYAEYIKKLNSVSGWNIPLESRPHENFSGFSDAPNWWKPPSPNETTKYRKQGSTVEITTFSNGFLYYMTYET